MNKTDICNIALSRIGNAANVSSIDPPEASAEAEHCAKFYDISRKLMLESFNWSFAVKHVDLGLVAESVNDYQYVYALPSDLIKLISVYEDGGTFEPLNQEWLIGQYGKEYYGHTTEMHNGVKSVFCNFLDCKIKYIFDQQDTTSFSSHFVEALSWLLAHYLCGPILKQDGLRLADYCYKNYLTLSEMAKRQDVIQSKDKFERKSSFSVARRW